MKITNNTTTHQIAELMGSDADELDGRIMMSLLAKRDCVDTDELSESAWLDMIAEACNIRRNEDEDECNAEPDMTKYQIESKAGVIFGTYEGATPEAAFNAMIDEGGRGIEGPDGSPWGTASDWIIREAE